MKAMIAVLPLMLATPAHAHVELVASNPAAGASVAKPTRMSLSFSAPLAADKSSVDLIMTAMPGMTDHPPMPIKGFKT